MKGVEREPRWGTVGMKERCDGKSRREDRHPRWKELECGRVEWQRVGSCGIERDILMRMKKSRTEWRDERCPVSSTWPIGQKTGDRNPRLLSPVHSRHLPSLGLLCTLGLEDIHGFSSSGFP